MAARHTAIRGGLIASFALSRGGLLRQARGRGAIFTLHHVRPEAARPFAPNGHLEVTPGFLETAILTLKAEGYRFVSTDDLAGTGDDPDLRPFACFTLDDGYRDNLEHAAPVFERHGVPFTVYATAGFIQRSHTLWWETATELLTRNDRVSVDFGEGLRTFTLTDYASRDSAFDYIASFIRGTRGTLREADAVAKLDGAARAHGIDPLGITERLTLDRAGIAALAKVPGATIGAHTVTHAALSRLPDAEALREMTASADVVADIIGRRPSSLAYPYGDAQAATAREERLAREAGFTTAVTTRPGVIGPSPAFAMLRRISLNGYYQRALYVRALASGIPFRLMAG
ncbi:Polysaccharide deacetylase [Rhizobium sp. RU20A]|uniref:polysaccharide deacetylase family protein n=1 Tax=Rhizobium sp. RU20A TaxID=1907412 RepID=UPI000953E629|nr:polysaccharide deacetylase family protein [Rhizobium sp. RU20A]SIR09840.1 Polysaccharide deacetylase [Rhizobium sp. RU20A]